MSLRPPPTFSGEAGRGALPTSQGGQQARPRAFHPTGRGFDSLWLHLIATWSDATKAGGQMSRIPRNRGAFPSEPTRRVVVQELIDPGEVGASRGLDHRGVAQWPSRRYQSS